ncbi:MAG TPA: hypothetical protein VMV31_04855 [Terriglobales bacterium]|nr:hypothetical protein [Terriglobales bacterium]
MGKRMGVGGILREMGEWERNLQYAAAGVAAAAAVEMLAGAGHSAGERLGRCLAAGGVAVAYGHLVPRGYWGVRSGMAFARLPPVRARSLQGLVWGGLTGWLLHAVQ